MLRSLQELKSYTIGATDGEIGHPSDLFFDDREWVIRYLVVETGSWLLSRKVLLSPHALMEADWMHKRLAVRITRDQVKNSPDVDSERPVSRQHELQISDYYGYPYYWERDAQNQVRPNVLAHDDPHLRSCVAVTGYHLHAVDGDIGRVTGMLIDEGRWSIRYLVVATGAWWAGHEVLVSPDWFTAIDWAESSVSVNMTRDAIKNSPAFNSSEALNRAQEANLHQHHRRPAYWEQEKKPLHFTEETPY